jgi:hypothetical protein
MADVARFPTQIVFRNKKTLMKNRIRSKTIKDIIGITMAAAMALLLAACATTAPTGPTGNSAATVAPAEPVEPWDGDGMDIPLDGTSLEAFDKSLARVKAYTSAEHYTTLVNAIDYLLVYDLSAKRDRAALAANLNGLTGHQVVDKVGWQKK